jgi:hypothetical protein
VTPIKEIWVILNTIYALDYADKLNFMANCGDEDSALQVGLALSSHHGVEAFAFKPSFRRMVPLGASSS